MFDLSAFRLPDMALCSTTVRRLGEGAASIEDAAGRITRYLYANLTTGPDDEPACVLVRLFKTHPYGRLSPELQALVDARLGDKPANPGMKCLTLLASTGAVDGWNNPAQSSRFRAIPLSGPDALATLPMFSQLFAQFHIDLPFLENASSSLLLDQYATTFNAFYVPQALNSPYVPGQEDFVIPFGVQSVLGCGGILPTGEMFALILFAKVAVPQETVDLFKTFALSAKLALSPFKHAHLVLPTAHTTPGNTPPNAPETLAALRDRVATLEANLAVQEHAVDIQSARLETSLADAIRHGQKLQKQSMRFETLSATSPIGIFETDAEGRCLYTNAAWQTITGLTLGESLGDGWSQAIALEDRERIIHTWSDIAGQGGKFDGKFRMQRPDGTIRWVHARSRPLTNEAGLVTGHVGTTEDITERTQTDLAIHESERRFRQMANTVPVLIWIADQTKACTWFNDRWLAFTGRTLEQEYGNGWADGVHPEDY